MREPGFPKRKAPMSCQTPLTVLVFLTWLQQDSVFSSVNSSPVPYCCLWAAFYLVWPSANLSSDFITESSWGVRTVKFMWKGSVRRGLSVNQGSHIRANTPGSMLYVPRLRHHNGISEEQTESKSEPFSCVLYAWLLPPLQCWVLTHFIRITG